MLAAPVAVAFAGTRSGLFASPAIGHAEAFPQPFPCMGHEALRQQGGVASPGGFRATACAAPSTAAHTGDSRNNPEVSAPRTRNAMTKARIERVTPASYN